MSDPGVDARRYGSVGSRRRSWLVAMWAVIAVLVVMATTATSERAGTPAEVSSAERITDGEEHQLVELFRATRSGIVHVHVERDRGPTEREQFQSDMLQAHSLAGFRGRISDPNGGSGFILDSDGHIVTTNRVIADATQIEVKFQDGTAAPASLVGRDPNTDLAVLKAEQIPATARPLKLGDSEGLQVGQRVAVLGDALGYGSAMTAGIVSALARNVRVEIQASDGLFTAPDLIQTDAAITPGMTGGALVNLDGQVVGIAGIDTWLFDAGGEGRVGGVGLCIPTTTLQRVLPSLLAEGYYRYPWLGVSARSDPIDAEIAAAMGLPEVRSGVLILDVTPGSPAAKAGVRGSDTPAPDIDPAVRIGGDLVVAFEGRQVRNFDELVSRLFREGTVGEEVTLTVIRNGKTLDLKLVLEERP